MCHRIIDTQDVQIKPGNPGVLVIFGGFFFPIFRQNHFFFKDVFPPTNLNDFFFSPVSLLLLALPEGCDLLRAIGASGPPRRASGASGPLRRRRRCRAQCGHWLVVVSGGKRERERGGDKSQQIVPLPDETFKLTSVTNSA